MKNALYIALMASLIGLAGCSEPPQPRTVTEFLDNTNLLEAALVRCRRNRSESRYEVECINAREAVRLSEARSEKVRRENLEAESKRKRDALRRTQWAAAEARRRAVEDVRRGEDAEYLAQFGELPQTESAADEALGGNVPMAVIPKAEVQESTPGDSTATLPTTGSNVPTMEVEPEPEPELASDLDAIREELRRRNDDGSEN